MYDEQPYYSLKERFNSFLISIFKNKKKVVITFGIFLILLFGYLFLRLSPKDFPLGQVVTIVPGDSLQTITNNLYDLHIIKSPFFFRTAVILQGGEKKMKAGDYLLDKKEGPIDLANRLVKGDFHLDVSKITIPEGWDVFTIADYLKKTLINFDKTKFLVLAQKKEGYLFPDTYFISPAAKPEKIIDIMSKNFLEKTKDVPGVSTSTRAFKDLITMASILEEEARTTESRRIISGILWKRLDIGMALQVDSTFSYVNGKNTYELTLDDLKIDSPYNTYLYRGLPPTPISNPGLDAIFSAANPVKTKYFYFLSSKSGKMYYAITFEEHKKNKELYLNK